MKRRKSRIARALLMGTLLGLPVAAPAALAFYNGLLG